MPRFRRVQTITHDIGADGELVLGVTSADVRLSAGSGGEVRLEVTFEVSARSESDADAILEEAQMPFEATAGRLRLVEDGSVGGLGVAISRMLGGHGVDLREVHGSAPAGCRIEVRAVSGDIGATGFTGTQRYQSVSGDLRIVEAAGDLDIETVSGDISFRAVDPVSLKLSSVSGDLRAEAPSYRRLNASAVSGDLSIDGALEAGPEHTVETVSGDFVLATSSGATILVRGLSSDVHASRPHQIEGNADRRRLVVGDGSASLSFNSMSGDMSVTPSRQAGSRPSAEPPPAAVAAPTGETAPDKDPRIAVLGALERGEIDVDEAMRRLGGE